MSTRTVAVELQRPAARGRLRVAEHDADLFPDLVDEDQAGLGFGDDAGELAQGLRHQPRLKARQRVAHVAIQFGLGNQRGDGINHHNVNGVERTSASAISSACSP